MPAVYPKGVKNKVAFDLGTLLDEAVFPGSVVARHAQSELEHVRDLNAWARQTADREGRRIPGFDPRSGGVHARVLILQQDPSRVAQYGSQMISRDNNDRTAHNTAALCDDVGLVYADALHWNVVPWWVGDPEFGVDGKTRSLSSEARVALPYLRGLLGMLRSSITKVVLVGKQAERVWSGLQEDRLVRSIEWRACPHTSPLAYNRVANREQTRRVFKWAAHA